METSSSSAHTSPWFDAVPDRLQYPALASNKDADVVVIGGGIVGVMTAWFLSQAGKRVVLLERGHLASSDTGFTTAFLTRDPDTSFKGLVSRYGAARANAIFAASRDAQQELFSLIRDEAIDCDFRECSAYFGSLQPDDAQLKQEWEHMRQADSDAQWLSGDDERLKGQPFRSAIQLPHEGRFHIRKFIDELLKRRKKDFLKVFEESEVHDIGFGDGVTVQTARGTVHAQQVVVATGMPLSIFPELAPLLKQKITYAIAARYEQMPCSDNIFWDNQNPYQYFRWFDDHTLILGGADTDLAAGKQRDARFALLKTFLREQLPGASSVTHQWSGELLVTEDGLPLAGEHPAYSHQVFVASGFSGNGMVMGTMAARTMTDLIVQKKNTVAEYFSLSRFGTNLHSRHSMQNPKTVAEEKKQTNWAMPIFVLLYATLFIIPGWIFFQERGGFGILHDATGKDLAGQLFPLFGLYAFFFVWMQFLLGSLMPLWRKLFPWVEVFHRTEGVFALLFALLHPALIFFAFGVTSTINKEYVDPSLSWAVTVGQIQLLLIILTAGTALFMRLPWLRKRWHYIHMLNYLVFALVWIHSWSLGTDVQATGLRLFWIGALASAVLAVVGRMLWARRSQVPRPHATQDADPYVRVASVDDLREGSPLCAKLGENTIALFTIQGSYYAIDNHCSHAGGSLCEGQLDGAVITCPLHNSKFDVRTGAVVEAPAHIAQQTYKVRVKGNDIFVATV